MPSIPLAEYEELDHGKLDSPEEITLQRWAAAYERGLNEGRLLGLQEAAILLVRSRFQEVSGAIVWRLYHAGVSTLTKVIAAVVNSTTSLGEIERLLL